MASHTSPAPTQTELLLDAGSLVAATCRLVVDHVCFKRIGVLLSVESELIADDRLPKVKGFGGILGCARHVTKYGGVFAGLLRGIGPHALIAVARKLRDVASHKFIAANPPLDPSTRSSPQLEVFRSVITPLALTALCWPVKAVYNVVLGNYMTDVVSPMLMEVTVNPNDPQQRLSYRYKSIADCFRIVKRRMGGLRNILNNGWEAYLVYRYLSYLLFEGAAFILAAAGEKCQGGKADAQTTATVRFCEAILREFISYPCNNIMMRMSLLDTAEAGDRVYGKRRYLNTADCISEVQRTEGLLGFYDGFRYHITVAGSILVFRYGAAMLGRGSGT